MTLVKYDPFAGFEFPTGLRLFEDTVSRLLSDPGAARPWSPNVDITETQNELTLKADVPGVDLKDIDIQFENGTLTVKGERKVEQEVRGQGYHRRERSFGTFMRCFALPETVDPDKVQASYLAGVLTITMPKKEVAKPRSIKVEIGKN
jgi:HSP20 family protein